MGEEGAEGQESQEAVSKASAKARRARRREEQRDADWRERRNAERAEEALLFSSLEASGTVTEENVREFVNLLIDGGPSLLDLATVVPLPRKPTK